MASEDFLIMLKRSVLISFLLAAGTLQAQETAAPDLEKGKQVASTICVACHNADGNSQLPANPKLAGQIPEGLGAVPIERY